MHRADIVAGSFVKQIGQPPDKGEKSENDIGILLHVGKLELRSFHDIYLFTVYLTNHAIWIII